MSRRLGFGTRAVITGLVLTAAGMAVLGAGLRGAASTSSGAMEGNPPAPAPPATPPPTPTQGMSGKIRPSVPDPGLLAVHAHGPIEALPSPVPMGPDPLGVLLVSAHTSGWITPCGCPGSQAGGVGRRAGYGELLQKTFPGLSVHYLDLGGFLGVGGDVQRATSEAVLWSMTRIGYEAANVAAADLGVTHDQAEFLDRNLKTPRFSANIVFHDNGQLAFAPYRIVSFTPRGAPEEEKTAIRVGLIGLVDDHIQLFAFGPDGRSLVTSSVNKALDRYLPELRAKSDLVVLMIEQGPGTLAPLLAQHKGIDFVVAGRGLDFVTEPRVIEGVTVIALGNQGKYLAELRIARQDGKLAIVPFVHWLDERFPEDPELAHFAESSLDRINEISRDETAKDTTPPPDIAPFVGATPCQSCHEDAFKKWQESRHAHATATLEKLKRDYTAACMACHITGYGAEAGGFVNPRATSQLLNVQCEVCHGPGQTHLENPSAPYGSVSKDLCRGCHSPATDPRFDYETRWKTITH